jgi:hypothetical protein
MQGGHNEKIFKLQQQVARAKELVEIASTCE